MHSLRDGKIVVLDSSGEEQWRRVFSVGSKAHFVHSHLLPALILDLELRGFQTEACEPCDSVHIDAASGVEFVHQPRELLKLDTMKISIPSRDIMLFHDQLIKLPQRAFKDGTRYFKLKSSRACVVLSENQRDMLEIGLELLYEEAEEKYMSFLDGVIDDDS